LIISQFLFFIFYVVCDILCYNNTVKTVLKGHLWDKEKVGF